MHGVGEAAGALRRDVMDHTMHCGMQVRRAPLALYAAHYGGGGGGGSGGGGSGGGSSGGGRGGSSADGTGGGVGVTAQQQQKQPWAACFPEHTPDTARSRWYSFPAMQPDELLLFTQYGDIHTMATLTAATLTAAILTMPPRPQARPYHASSMHVQTASSAGHRSCGTARCRG